MAIKEFPLANIARVTLETDSGIEYILTDVASEAEATAHLSDGEEQELRVQNTIKAQNNTEDIVMGYDISLGSATMIAEVLALVDGGELTGSGDEVTKYVAPPVGVAVSRTLFTTTIYTEEKDGDGSTLSYVAFTFKNCKGQPVDFSLQNGEFFSPELNIKSRSKIGESPMEVKFIKELPDASPDEVAMTSYEMKREGSAPATETSTMKAIKEEALKENQKKSK